MEQVCQGAKWNRSVRGQSGTCSEKRFLEFGFYRMLCFLTCENGGTKTGAVSCRSDHLVITGSLACNMQFHTVTLQMLAA